MSLTSPNRGFPLEKLEGNTGSMGTWVRTFDRTAEALGDLRTRAQRVSDLPGVGDSISRARTDAQALLGPVRSGIGEAELLSRVLAAYADAYSASVEPANRMIEEIEDAHAAWKRAAGEAEEAGENAARAAGSGTDVEADTANNDANDAIRAETTAKAALDELWETWERHYSAWDEAYDTALSSLASGSGSVSLTNDERALLDALLAANTPGAVLALWNEHPELRDALTQQYPDIIGNLDGIPYDTRATANLSRLTELHDRVDTLLEPLKTEVKKLWTEVKKHLGQLVSFDPNGSEQLTAAVWYGPFDAQNVSALVPGMLSNVSGIGEFGESARDLIKKTDDAAVAWFGYDSPDFVEEPSMGRAQDGAAALRSFLLGVDAQTGPRTINVIAHSYGSTTAALAIGSAPDGLGVDRFITAASAGFPDDPAVLENLRSSDAPQIFSTLSEDDAVARIGRGTSTGHPISPETLPGVTVFDSDGGVDSSGKELLPTPGHDARGTGAYLQPKSESFYNIREIVLTGHPGTERGGEGSTAGFWDEENAWIRNEYEFFDL